jgi:four helix bundle protein
MIETEKVNEIRERAFQFAVRIVKLCQLLEKDSGVGQTVARELIRSGTSIGATLERAKVGQNKADIFSKTVTALKETRETIYWLKILDATAIVPSEKLVSLRAEAEMLARIIGLIVVKNR